MGREIRAIPVMVYLEPSVHEAMLSILEREDTTASSYMRSLLLRALSDRGDLTDEMRDRLVGIGR